uniref:Uncharacterized protein n=1 Tax=Rhizophora mucronata TaxID=61149 RepID=A0A2P2NTZ8_RHIMU
MELPCIHSRIDLLGLQTSSSNQCV